MKYLVDLEVGLGWAKSIVVIFLGFYLGPMAKAQALAPLKILVQKGDQIQVRGFRGQIEYSVDEGAKDLTVDVFNPEETSTELSQWQFNLKRQGGVVLVEVEGPLNRDSWTQVYQAGQKAPKYNLRLKGPSLPMTVHWVQGSFKTKNYNNSLQVNLLDGLVSVAGGEGSLRIDHQKGLVEVKGRKGSVAIETYEGTLEVSGVTGDVIAGNFVGDTRVIDVDGGVKLVSFKGKTVANQVKGRLEFKNGNSPLHIENLEGELRGHSMQGPVFATIRGKANVQVESEEGPVSLRLPASGAWVNLRTNEGSLRVPSFLKLTRLPKQQIRTGRLRGSIGGRVVVKTTTGDIRLR